MKTLFDILNQGERIIVHSEEQAYRIYTWNQAYTLECWEYHAPNMTTGEWKELGMRNLAYLPVNFYDARRAAVNWSKD